MSESEVRSAAQACVDGLVRRGRPHLAARVGERVDRLIGLGQTSRALAVIALFR